MNSVLGQGVVGEGRESGAGRVTASGALPRTRVFGPRFGARGLSRIITEKHCAGRPQYVRRLRPVFSAGVVDRKSSKVKLLPELATPFRFFKFSLNF